MDYNATNLLDLPNEPDYSKRIKLDKNTIEAKLWSLLDDIDTASDMFKPEQTPFYKYVMRKAEERTKYITSDGYNLFKPSIATER